MSQRTCRFLLSLALSFRWYENQRFKLSSLLCYSKFNSKLSVSFGIWYPCVWLADNSKPGTCTGDSNFLLCIVGNCDQQYGRIVKLKYEDCLGYLAILTRDKEKLIPFAHTFESSSLYMHMWSYVEVCAWHSTSNRMAFQLYLSVRACISIYH